MPSGLTSKIYDGSDVTLRGFALKCLTHLGAGYRATNGGEKELPRDKAPVLKVSDYHLKQLELGQKELNHWIEVKNNPEECRRLYLAAHEKRADDNVEISKQRAELLSRYQKMKAKVESWNIPEKYNSLKELMLKQLNNSIEWDCIPSAPSEEKVETMDEWINAQIECAEWNIDYHKKEYANEQKNIAETNEYLKGVYDALDEFEYGK